MGRGLGTVAANERVGMVKENHMGHQDFKEMGKGSSTNLTEGKREMDREIEIDRGKKKHGYALFENHCLLFCFPFALLKPYFKFFGFIVLIYVLLNNFLVFASHPFVGRFFPISWFLMYSLVQICLIFGCVMILAVRCNVT
ncbi:hypothetical protein DVH24_011639 [Malus domestica]|uniref:Uncharacterized protein n=1 Tax=Malus domestica TaxID=3750 RepID=A0A498K050_MALDO|nr:hypothetical protein DVH24_011639 [Malus domestica]